MTPPASLLARLVDEARRHRRHIVLCEGEDMRVWRAGLAAAAQGVARISFVGAVPPGVALPPGVAHLEPATSPLTPGLAAEWHRLRAAKGMTAEMAAQQVQQPLVFAHLMVAQGLADGAVSGAVHTTADVVRTAIQTIGIAPGAALVSSFFLMLFEQPHHGGRGSMVFADCGLVVHPDAEQLSHIAQAAAASAERLLGEPARVAMLSYSTQGSADHARVSKVREATRLLQARCPGLRVEGEMQLDAALVPEVAARKLPGSAVGGRANVLIFPDLDAGNIGYKLVERLAGATAIGPLLQGLRRPANDLSRGCTEGDVLAAIALTGLQCA